MALSRVVIHGFQLCRVPRSVLQQLLFLQYIHKTRNKKFNLVGAKYIDYRRNCCIQEILQSYYEYPFGHTNKVLRLQKLIFLVT